jgi:hypothetical protein
MKYTFFIICILAVSSCFAIHNAIEYNQPLHEIYLTNDSVKFWQTDAICDESGSCYGLYFAKDSTCEEYFIDKNDKRVFKCYYDIIVSKPFHYKLTKDSLKAYNGGCSLERCSFLRYKILKLTNDSLVVQETYILFKNKYTDTLRYFRSKDQYVKPKYWYELYPDDKSKWPHGTY